jgi:hypothetical protein
MIFYFVTGNACDLLIWDEAIEKPSCQRTKRYQLIKKTVSAVFGCPLFLATMLLVFL